MIYEVRTYRLKPGSIPECEKRFAEALPHREKYSPLGAFWHTEIGPLNQIIHVWPYGEPARADRKARPSHAGPELATQDRQPDRTYGIGNLYPGSVHGTARQKKISVGYTKCERICTSRAPCQQCSNAGQSLFPPAPSCHPWPPVGIAILAR